MKESLYLYLLKDSNFKRWYDNVARGTIITATVWLTRVGMLQAKFGKSPQQIAKMKSMNKAAQKLARIQRRQNSAKKNLLSTLWGSTKSMNTYLFA